MKTSGFEIPAEMKALAEQGIEATRQAFQGYLSATEKAQGPKPKQDKSHETPAQRYDALRSTGKIGPNKGGEIGTTRYDEQCLQRLEAWALASRPSN